jgi:carbohydrate-selective porin OprB
MLVLFLHIATNISLGTQQQLGRYGDTVGMDDVDVHGVHGVHGEMEYMEYMEYMDLFFYRDG